MKEKTFETKFVIQTNWMYQEWVFLRLKKGVLWKADITRLLKSYNATVFDSRKECYEAINKTINYGRKNNFDWGKEFRIIPITLNFKK